MPAPVVLTEKLLMDTGGWKAMKEAGRIHGAGAVEEATYENGVLEGRVVSQGKARKVRVDIKTRTWWDNHCSCPVARREGAICAHALAVALQTINPIEAESTEAENGQASPGATPGPGSTSPAKPAPSADWPRITERPDDAKARPAELYVVLAPQIARGWEKERLTVGIEIIVEGRDRCLLSALNGKSERLFLGPRDVALFRSLQAISPGEVPGMIQVGRPEFLRLLEALAGHPRVTLGKATPASIAFTPLRLALRLEGTRILVDWPEDTSPLVHPESGTSAWCLVDTMFQPVAPGLSSIFASLFSDRGYTLEPGTCAVALSAFRENFEVPDTVEARLPEPVAPEVFLDLEGSLNHLEAKLAFDYGEGTPRRKAGAAASKFLPASDEDSRLRLPDFVVETRASAFLTSWGFDGPDDSGRFVIKNRDAILRFFAHGRPRIDPAWKVSTGPRFEHASEKVEPVTATFEFASSSGENWFAMEVEFDTASGSRFSRESILQLLQKGQNHQSTPSGKIAVIDTDLVEDLQETLTDLEASQQRPGLFEVGRQHAAYLQQTAADSGIETRGDLPWKTTSSDAFEPLPLPAAVEDTLRPYQREGIDWMLALAQRGQGGILADDMGLGKTLQALALIHSLGEFGPALVVCPSSLVFNWMAEAERFFPELQVIALQGPDRQATFEANPDADLFLTSHTLLRLDADHYRQREFGTVILDEAQHIKNPDAQVAKAAHAIRARYRFALTGTPIENSVRDLWSVMQFAQPGYLGARKEFGERFEKPITGGNAPGVQRRLARRLDPVILRRLKSEVARDLPEKIEQVIYCDLHDEQRAVYEQVLRESRTAVHEAEGGRQRMLALTALLRLRQACCDLRLLGLPDVTPDEASVKLDAVEELIADAVEGGHRVLVFSQFVEMLQVLVPMLADRGWKHAYLDGSTRNRGEVVRRFQEGGDIPVFLISLKAGGVGLNLTAADTVIHVDPWWNPAVEAQATDRAHRIGQERVVTSYKLIARGTVEEKILSLQEKKKKAFRSLIDTGSESGDASLSGDEILELID